MNRPSFISDHFHGKIPTWRQLVTTTIVQLRFVFGGFHDCFREMFKRNGKLSFRDLRNVDFMKHAKWVHCHHGMYRAGSLKICSNGVRKVYARLSGCTGGQMGEGGH
jgi:hypothetical protein